MYSHDKFKKRTNQKLASFLRYHDNRSINCDFIMLEIFIKCSENFVDETDLLKTLRKSCPKAWLLSEELQMK